MNIFVLENQILVILRSITYTYFLGETSRDDSCEVGLTGRDDGCEGLVELVMRTDVDYASLE